ncbi:hypothetical protein AB4Y86_16475, partial [Arthrobacter sp. 2YAF22_2]
ALEGIVAACGYNSARGLGDIASQIPGSAGSPLAETLPPADAFLTKAPDQIDSTWTLQNMKDLTLKAEPGGGWMQYTFHHINAAGEPLSIPTADFNALIDFLAAEQAAGRVVVKTVDQAMGGAVKPLAANGPPPPAPITSGNLLRNPGFETAGAVAGSPPYCWVPGSYGANTYTSSTVATAHTGTAATQVVMSAYTNGDAKVLPPLDTGQCAPSVTAGHSYTMSAWYTSTAKTQFELYYRIGQGAWHYWTSSPFVLPAATFTQTSWTSPPVPAGATAMSMALTLTNLGTLVTDDYSLLDSGVIDQNAAAAIAAKAAAVQAVGLASGSIVCGLVSGGCYQLFTNGAILWSAATGAHTSMGDIRALWAAYGYERGYFGYPTSDTVGGLVGGGYYQTFQNGAMISSSTTGAHVSYGAVRDKWGQYGFQNGILGYPTTDQIGGLINGGAYQMFQNGAILWAPATGPHISMGVIRNAWAAQGYERGALAYPTSDIVSGLVNAGTYQNFQGGAIIWSAATGAQISRGGIRVAWASQGYENGRLGYPTSNEYVVGNVTYQDYVGGRISWTAASGTVISYK